MPSVTVGALRKLGHERTYMECFTARRKPAMAAGEVSFQRREAQKITRGTFGEQSIIVIMDDNWTIFENGR